MDEENIEVFLRLKNEQSQKEYSISMLCKETHRDFLYLGHSMYQ